MAAERLTAKKVAKRFVISAGLASAITAKVLSGGAGATTQTLEAAPPTTEAGPIPFISPLPPNGSPELGSVPPTGPIADQATTTTEAQSASPNVYYAPPHDLEKFFIAVNYKIAQILHVNPVIINTKQHVEGELAQAISEGGDINNNSVNNPLNSGLYAPNLTVGWPNASGYQGFASFSDGVEATAITMTKPQYSRIPDCLTNPDCTAVDYVEDVVLYNRWKNNNFWAQADSDKNLKEQTRRVNELIRDAYYVENNYDLVASTEMSTSAFEWLDHKHAPKSDVVY